MILSSGLVLWTAEQAAQGAGVSRNAIDVWIYRKHLRQAADPNGVALYDDERRMLFWATDIAKLAAEKRSRGSGERVVVAPTLPDDVASAVWTLAEIVQSVGVIEVTARRWIASGALAPVNPGDSGEPVYRVLDVARVERSTRRRARRRFTAA